MTHLTAYPSRKTGIALLALVLAWSLVMNAEGGNPPSLEDKLKALQHTVANLAKQAMSQQLSVEERVRSSGSSGIKVTRSLNQGNSNYHTSTHISGGVAAIHDHANYKHAVGMGETVVVLNGVEFRTRHNDYKIVRPSTTDKTYGAVEYVDTPEVPPKVLAQKTVQGQMEEMRQWFKAFHQQDITIRDYRNYFKPVLCYLEGAWTLDEDLNEPFESERHTLVAGTWDELQQQIRYTSFTGTKDLKENFSFLPTSIMAVDKVTGQPRYAQWNYRILCHPVGHDVPTAYFRQQDDLAYRESTGRTPESVLKTRAARFRLSEYGEERFTGANSLLDTIMKAIPGKDNVPEMLNEAPFGIPVYDTEFRNYTLLNTGYYHRSFKTSERGAMGLMNIYRGFNDEFLFVAETTQPNIASESFKYCKTKRDCVTSSTSFSYAIPLEVIYLTPLTKWNPYKIPIWPNKKTVLKGKRKGKNGKPYNGTSPDGFYYLTPAEFYGVENAENDDPADTTQFGAQVLDGQGNVRRMAGSGTRTFTLPITGAGRVRLRYPIMPVHGEGSSVWKELSVVKKKLKAIHAFNKATTYYIELPYTASPVYGLHRHEFYLTLEQMETVRTGGSVSVVTSLHNGHRHQLELWLHPNRGVLEYKLCDGVPYCADGHRRKLKIIESPTS